MDELAAWQWALGAACAFCVGVAKTGIPGLGIFAVPLFVFVVPASWAAAGALLPLLIAADVFAVVWYRKHARWDQLLRLSPWITLGLIGGAITLAHLPESVLNPAIGAIVLAMVAIRCFGPGGLARSGAPATDTTARPGLLPTALFGSLAGYATTISNAAGPVMNLYLLGQRLPKEVFIATGAWLFFIVNLVKVPIFVHQGMITGPSLLLDAILVPGVVLGALTGRELFARFPQRTFEWTVLILAAIASLALMIPRG